MSEQPPASTSVPKRADPQSFRARSMSISLTVGDLDHSCDWYVGSIGFALDRSFEREGRDAGIVLKAGAVRIMLTQDDGAKGADRAKGVGISVHFTTAQDVDELADRIKADGGTLEMDPTDMAWGARVFRVRDPDGYLLTISSVATPPHP